MNSHTRYLKGIYSQLTDVKLGQIIPPRHSDEGSSAMTKMRSHEIGGSRIQIPVDCCERSG